VYQYLGFIILALSIPGMLLSYRLGYKRGFNTRVAFLRRQGFRTLFFDDGKKHQSARFN